MLLSFDHITKFHNEKCILNDVSFAIEEQDKIALVGINGTGKTTLLRILIGLEPFKDGNIIRMNGLRIAYLPQNPVFDEEDTILSYMERNLRDDHPVEAYEIKAVLNKLGMLQHHESITVLSGGQKKRVALAAALLQPCDLLILDEPTNHLDHDMVEWLEKYLIRLNRALIMVTHDRYFLERVTNRIMEIDRNQIYIYEGSYSKFLEMKEQREEMAKATERKRHSILKKELEWVRAGVQARGTKSRERLERFEKLNAQASIQDIKDIKLDALASRLGKKTIEIENISKSYGEFNLFHDFTYHMKRSDRIGILGPNGCGKSTLLNIIAKLLTPDSGHVIHGETVRIAYYKQGYDDMDEHMKVIDYIKETGNEIHTEEGCFSASVMLERFLFDAQLQYTNIGRLSGGERRRLYLLKVLMQMPNIIFLDEPTNDLDIQTLTILEDYLDQFAGAVVTVSHDRYFLDRICDKVFVFQKDKTLKQCIGGYSMYLEHEHMVQTSTGEQKVSTNNDHKQPNRILPKMTSAEKRDLETMEEQIEQIQIDIDAIDERMMHTDIEFKELEQLSSSREDKLQQMEDKMEYWMQLSEKKQQIEDMKRK